jgi:GT2 family glycosyltransferase
MQRDAVAIYSDDDTLNSSAHRVAPRFKPDWSLAHLLATNYVGDAVVVRGAALAAVGGLDEETCRYGLFDKILQIVDLKSELVFHLPDVLLHRGEGDCPRSIAWEMHAVQRHLVRRGIATAVSPTLPGCRRIRYQLPPSPPLVSIIIPTRDGLEILRRCVDSILAKTTYARYEILVVDNQSCDPAALAYLREIAGNPAVRVLPFDQPFNFSAINNFAAGEARGELLCLLNNDTEVITPDWLEEMVGNLMQDQVGVVGAKLFYPDGSVQHAGDTVGPGGCANHLHNGIARDDPGYCNRAAVAQDLSAVTAACLLTRRDLYLKLGGLDARWLKVAFNDVDYCLRVRAAGWRVVWTPHAELYHHESVSRGKNNTWRKILRSELEVAVMCRRWRDVMRSDPFYNPNLNYRQPDFTPGRTLRIKKPWQ